MTTIKDIIQVLESFAPSAYQESYDNAQLLVGNRNENVTGVLVTLDVIESIVDEAIAKKCNLIVAHHPIVFKGLKSLTGKDYIERTILKAIKNDIAIYACHTNLDHVQLGVNHKIAQKLRLENTRILAPKKNVLEKITVFVPKNDAEKVRIALNNVGAGQIGNYQNCSFQSEGIGTFQPNEKATPHIGENGKLEQVTETRLEMIFPNHLEGKILAALRKAHPYEEIAYYLETIENANQEVGAGMIGNLKKPMKTVDFLQLLKKQFNLSVIRHTAIHKDTIESVALCGGAGSFLLKNAKGQQADIFITGDFKYHEFFDAENQIIIADIGHYESEFYTKELFYEILQEKFSNIVLIISEVNTNPIVYTI